LPTIDVHAHHVPPAFLAELSTGQGRFGATGSWDGETYRVAIGSNRPTAVPAQIVDVKSRIETMDRTGVDVQILSTWMRLSACELAGDVSSAFARAFNEAMAAVVADHPHRFLALANLPMRNPEAAADELRHCVAELGMVGAEIATRPGWRDLDDACFEPVWSAAEELGCALVVHPLHSLAGRAVERHFLGNLVGNPAESTVAIGHVVFGGVKERHPKLQLCFVHGGGFAPYQIGRWDHAFHNDVRGAAANLTVPPSECLRTMYFDTVVHSPLALGYLVAAVGADQVVMGSDYPFEMGEHAPVDALREAPGIDERQAAGIACDNALALIGKSHVTPVDAGRPGRCSSS
jgi:aminocarboxymuconate-semialdehyde decarboxylase